MEENNKGGGRIWIGERRFFKEMPCSIGWYLNSNACSAVTHWVITARTYNSKPIGDRILSSIVHPLKGTLLYRLELNLTVNSTHHFDQSTRVLEKTGPPAGPPVSVSKMRFLFYETLRRSLLSGAQIQASNTDMKLFWGNALRVNTPISLSSIKANMREPARLAQFSLDRTL